jgi:predicted kinase
MCDTVRLVLGTLVVTVGVAGSGKTTFVERQFPAETIVSADRIRHELAGDAAIQDLDARVWRVLFGRVHARLSRGLLTVVDSTAASAKTRRSLRRMAALHRAPLLFLVFATPLAECFRRNAARRDGLRSARVPPSVIEQQFARLAHVLRNPGHLQGGRVVVVRPVDAERLRFEVPSGVGNTRAAGLVIPCASRREGQLPKLVSSQDDPGLMGISRGPDWL